MRYRRPLPPTGIARGVAQGTSRAATRETKDVPVARRRVGGQRSGKPGPIRPGPGPHDARLPAVLEGREDDSDHAHGHIGRGSARGGGGDPGVEAMTADAGAMDRRMLREWGHRFHASGPGGECDRPRRNGPRASAVPRAAGEGGGVGGGGGRIRGAAAWGVGAAPTCDSGSWANGTSRGTSAPWASRCAGWHHARGVSGFPTPSASCRCLGLARREPHRTRPGVPPRRRPRSSRPGELRGHSPAVLPRLEPADANARADRFPHAAPCRGRHPTPGPTDLAPASVADEIAFGCAQRPAPGRPRLSASGFRVPEPGWRACWWSR